MDSAAWRFAMIMQTNIVVGEIYIYMYVVI